jgi:hypothetical protein
MTPDTTPLVETDEHIDATLLGILIHDDTTTLWTIDELVRELGDRVSTLDSLTRLHRAGLIHRIDHDFIQASRAARYSDRLAG